MKDWRSRWYVLTEWHLLKYRGKRNSEDGKIPLRVYPLYKIKATKLHNETIRLRYKSRILKIKGTDTNQTTTWYELLDKYIS